MSRNISKLKLRNPKLASTNLIAFIVAACGGGGGGSSSSTPTPTPTPTPTNTNTAPTDIALSSLEFVENAVGIEVGTLSSVDVDSGDTFTYSLSGTDADQFEISGSTLKLKADVSADFETKSSYAITVTTTDAGGLTYSEDFTISVTNANETPTDITLSSDSVVENTAGAEVGILSSTDPDSGDTFTYSLSGTDADQFEISGSTLKLKANVSAVYATKSSYAITVTTADAGGLIYAEDFIVSVVDKVKSLAISNASINENTLEVGTLTTDSTDTIVYSISGGVDSDSFSIDAGKLVFKSAPDFETPGDLLPTFEAGGDPDIPRGKRDNTYEVIVTATDSNGFSVSNTFFVSVSDVNETVSGVLIDGYVAGATVFQDLDNDGVLDAGEPFTTTDATGAFTLTLQSPSPNAPIRVINSGFDTAANDLLRAILDISATTSGAYILTPLSTLHARLLSLDTSLYKDDAEKLVADLFGITLANVPNTSLFGYDPIATMVGSGAEATKSQIVYTANQLLMTLGHLTSALGEYMGPKALANAQTAIQTILDNSSISATASLSWGSTVELKSASHDAFTNALAAYLKENQSATVTDFLSDTTALADILAKTLVNIQDYLTKSIGKISNENTLTIDGVAKSYTAIINEYSTSSTAYNGFRMDSSTVTLTDYLDSNASTANTHKLYSTTSSSTITADLVGGTMDQDNLSNIVSSNSSTGKSPVLSFALDSIPNAGESGTASVTMKLYDGSDATKANGERLLETTVSVNWSSDGTTVTFTLPAQSLNINYHTTGGSILQRTYANASPDILEVTKAGTDNPAALDLRVASFFSGQGDSEGVDLTGYITTGNYFYEVSFSGLNFKDASDNAVNKFQGAFTVADTPGVAAYAEDVVVGETGVTATVTVTLSKASSSAVTIDYQTADGTALAGSDYTATSGTLTIVAGSTSGTFTIPITSDDIIESLESFTVNLSSPTNAVLGRSTLTANIIDNATWVKTYTEAFTSGATQSLTSLFSIVDTYVTNSSSGSPSAQDLATALTKINTGIKAIDFTQIMGGTLISDSGTFASGVTQSSFDTNLSGKVTTVITAAAETIGDVLGTDTASNFPNAIIKILSDGNDTANGTAQSDLIATLLGDDTVNSLAGNDKIIGGSGIDTFDGGAGDDNLYGYVGNDVLTGGDGNDKIVGGLGNDILSGGAGNDTLYGQTGNDTITTGAGNDIADGGLGDDTFNITSKSGSYTDTIKGSAGTDTLDIDYSGAASLNNFTISSSSDNITLTDVSGGSITFSSIENLTVGDYAYTHVQTRRDYDNPTQQKAFWNATEKVLYLYDGASLPNQIWEAGYGGSAGDVLPGLTKTMDVSVKGSTGGDTLNINVSRSTYNSEAVYSGNWTMDLGDGNDVINSGRLQNGDSIDMGAGDDSVSAMFTGTWGTPTIGNADLAKLDGGAGTDTLSFEESTPATDTELTLTTAGATNFENLTGGSNAEVLKGDNNANVLRGNNGSDTLYGYGGNDTLYSDASSGQTTYTSGNQNDVLYGGAGNDTMYGSVGDNTLDGGTGADTITSGGGSDTIVLRSGDGGSTQVAGDTVTDFTDGTDSLGLDSLAFGDLTIEQIGSDTVIKEGSNFLLTLTGISASSITVLDFQSTSTSNQTFNGTSGNDTFIGGAGNDTFNGGAGSDTLLGWSGNDTFNITSKSGSYTDTIKGSAGTDTLDIDYSGAASLNNFTISSSSDNITLTDVSGGSITFSSIENLTVGDYAYTHVQTRRDYDNPTQQKAFWNATEKVLYLYDGASLPNQIWEAGYGGSAGDVLPGLTKTMDVSVKGSTGGDTLNINVSRSTYNSEAVYSGNWTMDLGDGNDVINSGRLQNGDSIDMGAGDDSVSAMFTGTWGTPTIGNADLAKLDGGAGTDTLSFEESTPATDTELTLTTAGATNFENLTGGSNAEVLKGDNNANVLRGNNGSDTLYGYGGNDTLYSDASSGQTTYTSGNQNDVLYGGAGNDTMYGSVGDNTLDGGTGADTITSGGGIDTFVLRVGSGGSAITDADTFKDFTDGTDLIGLDNGLAFSGLTIEQGTGSYSSHTIIKAGSEYLAVVENMTASDLTESSFTPVSIDESGTENAQLVLGNAMIDNGSLDLDFSGVTASPSLSVNLIPSEMNETDFNLLIEADALTFELETGFINLPSSSENAPQEIEDFVQYENLFSEALITLEEEDFLFVSMDL